MTRSRRKTPKVGITTARSEKFDKQVMHRRLRRKSKLLAPDPDAVFPIPDEVMNKWSMAKDGKCYVSKKSSYYKQALRK